ncbi:hypothetical protein PVAP13_1KG033350 [Panicum virgatum]|uniref:Uncharacterized protein n=1 Tax=Panicum virgatum TaxID=38727 RepID=A0A8T0X8H3_PANVG|nr:hypothetical protein PVAP13_1KG033350 [Panicum virgatum]
MRCAPAPPPPTPRASSAHLRCRRSRPAPAPLLLHRSTPVHRACSTVAPPCAAPALLHRCHALPLCRARRRRKRRRSAHSREPATRAPCSQGWSKPLHRAHAPLTSSRPPTPPASTTRRTADRARNGHRVGPAP